MKSVLRLNLYSKLAIALAVLCTLVGLFFALLIGVTTTNYQQEITQHLNQDLAEHIIAERLLLKDGKVDQEALEHIFHMMMVINPKIELYLLDPGGRVLSFSAPPGKVVRHSIDLEPVLQYLGGDVSLPLAGDDPRDAQRRKVFSVAPIEQHGELEGYLYVILGGEQYDSINEMLAGSYVMRVSAAIGLAGLVFALLAGMVLFAVLTRRLRRLARAMEAFRRDSLFDGQPEPRIVTGDELDRMRVSFNEMAARITEQMEKLQHTDSMRRELVANVSHDLRTPLASLQGYLETLRLKEDDLGDEDRRHYLDIAFKHSTRLGELVAELFELAKLDANEVKPNIEPFSLPELVQDVLQKFELRARENHIRLISQIAQTIPFVEGDIALIERVLDNLLENALRFTPANGSITISLVPHSNVVSVEIADTGCGIEPRHLPYVFDRFYKADDEHRRESAGSGLGLAIARRILELHGSIIRAASEYKSGAAFTFDLPTFTNQPAEPVA
jgi:two-component system, OmpR family, sensor kinase